jgi:hypothetical protein
MVKPIRGIFSFLLFGVLLAVLSCRTKVESNQNVEPPSVAAVPTPSPQPTAPPTPTIPNLQAELLDGRNKTTNNPIGKFDFKNFTYELPRGWQNPDGTAEIRLTNGRVAPVDGNVKDEMGEGDRVVARSERRIGLSYVTTKYFDVTGDGLDEAVVVLKIETGGSAIPQIVYVFTWNQDRPELIWPFRTGDRADGGLKDIYRNEERPDMVVVELYGQDRFVLGQTETGKITDDREQLCCPTHFTRAYYKWNGKNFLMQGKRLTFSVADVNAAPVENMGDIVNAKTAPKK